MMTVGVHAEIRELYHGFAQSPHNSAMAVDKTIGDKRGRLKHLLIGNFETPKEPLYTAAAAGQPMAFRSVRNCRQKVIRTWSCAWIRS